MVVHSCTLSYTVIQGVHVLRQLRLSTVVQACTWLYMGGFKDYHKAVKNKLIFYDESTSLCDIFIYFIIHLKTNPNQIIVLRK